MIAIAALLIAAAGGIYFYYGFLFKEARNIETEMPDFSITAAKLIEDYNSNPEKANSLYLNKTIELTGQITKETDSVLILEKAVFCLFTQKIKNKVSDHNAVVKGKCIGYDELFQEIKLDQCTIIKPHN